MDAATAFGVFTSFSTTHPRPRVRASSSKASTRPRRRRRFVPAVERRLGRLQALVREVERLAVVRRQQQQTDRLAGILASGSCTVKKLPSDLLIFSPEMLRKPLCIQYFAMTA